MYIKSLKLDSYRNYKSCELEFSDGINILFGDNAQGKTNILEAIYLSATTKSHRGSKDKEIINFDSDESHIRSLWDKRGIEYRVDMHLRKMRSKGIALNGNALKKASQLIGICSVVFFSPEDLSIIKNGPSERRRFIDMELSQMDLSYLYNLNQYSKVVNQRNALLKDYSLKMNGFDRNEMMDVLSVWNTQLIDYGKKIIKRRENFINDLNNIIYDIHSEISGNKEILKIIYDPDTKYEDFEYDLEKSADRDLKYKSTNIGPHRDDIIFEVNGNDVRKFGSQGQQRTVALSLKLSEIEMLKKMKDDDPVLLLDDVLSELDSNRQKFLLDKIGNIQTIITCTGLDEFVNRRLKIDNVFNIENGTVKHNE